MTSEIVYPLSIYSYVANRVETLVIVRVEGYLHIDKPMRISQKSQEFFHPKIVSIPVID